MKARTFIIRLAAVSGFALALSSAPLAMGYNAGTDAFPGPSANSPGISSNETNLTAFTVEGGEPGHGVTGNNGALHTAWWTYTAPENGFLTVDTVRSTGADSAIMDTVLSVYTGNSVNALTVVARNDDYSSDQVSGDRLLSRVVFYAQKDAVYRIAVDGYSSGSITASTHNVVLTTRLIPLRKRTLSATFRVSTAPGGMGFMTLTTTGSSSFSGKLTLGTSTYPMTGAFGIDGMATVSFERKVPAGTPPLPPITLVLGGALAPVFDVTVPESGRNYGSLYEQAVFALGQPNPVAGYYTAYVAFPGLTPRGIMAVTVSPAGVATGAATMPDGTAVTLSGPLATYPTSASYYYVPAFKSLASGKGVFTGTLTFVDSGANDVLSNSDGYYIRPAPAPGGLFYPTGISTTFLAAGSIYPKPVANTRVLGFLDSSSGAGHLHLYDAGGELGGDIDEGLLFSTANKFTFGSVSRKPALTLNTATGVVTGSINEPALKKHTFTGILSKSGGGTVTLYGFGTGTAQNLRLEVTP